MSGDFNQGYGIGHGAGVNAGAASVDTQSYYDSGYLDGRVYEHNQPQAYNVQRLMSHLIARDSQKQALLHELKKYAPDHPYLNSAPVETPTTKVLAEVADPMVLQQVMSSHVIHEKRPYSNTEVDRDYLSRLLVHSTGGAVTTQGDLAMAADGAAFVVGKMDEEYTAKIQAKILADFNEFNPNIAVADARARQYNKDFKATMKAAEAAKEAADKLAKAEREVAEKLAAHEKNERLKAAGVGFFSRLFLHHD